MTGGYGNLGSGYASAVGGGYGNTNLSDFATVGGGYANTSSGDYATVAGGSGNTSGRYGATVGGGQQNTGGNAFATVGGGQQNSGSGWWSTVGGGGNNNSGGDSATVGGGSDNRAGGGAATGPGGFQNSADGKYSFAAGNRAQALHDGSFVWGDSTAAAVASTNADSWTVRAGGGLRFFSDPTASVGVQLPPGANAWSAMSDRNVKENFKPVDPRAVLEKLTRLPVTEWNLLSQPARIRHIGPMAQDFAMAFEVGEDDRHISTTDADGIALAAIQGLNQKLEEEVKTKEARILKLEKDVAELKAMMASLLR